MKDIIERDITLCHPAKGKIPFSLSQNQEDYLSCILGNKNSFLCGPRQSGRSSLVASYALITALASKTSVAYVGSHGKNHIKTIQNMVHNHFNISKISLAIVGIDFENGSRIECTYDVAGKNYDVIIFEDVDCAELETALEVSQNNAAKIIVTGSSEGDGSLYNIFTKNPNMFGFAKA